MQSSKNQGLLFLRRSKVFSSERRVAVCKNRTLEERQINLVAQIWLRIKACLSYFKPHF